MRFCCAAARRSVFVKAPSCGALREPAQAAQPVSLLVTKSLGLSEAVARISPSGAASAMPVATGDRLEDTKWAAPEEPNLKVYVSPPAAIETIHQAAERLAPLRDDPSVHWVDDPTVESPTDVLRWSSDRWMLDHIGKPVKTLIWGLRLRRADVKKALPNGGRFFRSGAAHARA